jgi:platelet-activating factor acetylhydrolase
MSFLNPKPRFPSYTGPYNVGTTEFEFATADLDSPTPCPDDSISTVKFRLFYPTEEAPAPSNSLRWLSDPQRENLSAFGRFLGASAFLSEVFSYVDFLF